MAVGSFSGLSSGIQWRDMVDQIMQLEVQRKLTPVSNQISASASRKEAWTKFSGLLDNVSTAASGLQDGSAFSAFGVTVTDNAVISASASGSAAPGTYGVEVSQLARQEKVASATAFTSQSEAQGLTGTFQVNGKSVTLDSGDSLSQIRDKINAANSGNRPSGVTASIVTVSDTDHRLVLTADGTGSRGIELVDSASGGGVLRDLGVVDGSYVANTRTVTNPDDTTTTFFESQRFSDRATPVAQMLGLTSPPDTASIMVSGVKVQIDLQNDRLEDVLNKMQAALADAGKTPEEVADVRIASETVGGQTMYRLSTSLSIEAEVDGDAVPVASSQRALELLGFQRGAYTDVRQAGQDAQVTVDGYAITRRSNTVSDALSGLTMTLKSEGSSNLTVQRNLDSTVNDVQKLVDAFNAVVDFQQSQMKADAPLRANSSLRTAVNSLKNVLLSGVEGIDPEATAFTRPSMAGVELTKNGKLEIDKDRLKSALTTNFDEVMRMFGSGASTSNSDIQFITETASTAPGSYGIEITQAAEVARVAGSGWNGIYTDDGQASTANRITITDAYDRSVTVDLSVFSTTETLQQELSRRLAEEGVAVTATANGNDLSLSGTRYGSAATFTVAYSRDEGGTITEDLSSPIGVAAGSYAGIDIAGTIGGEAATGSGRVLTAAERTVAEGLVVSYSGAQTGAVGDVSYVTGFAGALSRVVEAYTDPLDGMIKQTLDSINESAASLERREMDVLSRLDRYEASLIQRFVAMESAMSMMQSQGNWLASQISSMQSSNGNR